MERKIKRASSPTGKQCDNYRELLVTLDKTGGSPLGSGYHEQDVHAASWGCSMTLGK